MALPALRHDAQEVSTHHLLVLPTDVGPEEVETLAVSRFPRASWEATVVPRPRGGARRPGNPPPGVLRLSRVSTLVGPYGLDRDTAAALALPPSAGVAYVVKAPVERGAPPWAGGGDRDGLRRAFPDGMPVRDEERVVDWAIAAARRLGGALRTAPRGDAEPVLLVPDPAAAVDLTVWSDLWLRPDDALTVMRQAVPRAHLNLPSAQWAGPPPGIGQRAVPGAESLTPQQRMWLHAEADAYDRAALTDPEPMHAYGALADLELDGMLALGVSGETRLPPVIAGLQWAGRGAVAYRVTWEPADLDDAEAEHPSLQHRVARGRVAPLVVAVTRAVHTAVGGEINDMMDFVVDPADL